jgi:hypothetical protein
VHENGSVWLVEGSMQEVECYADESVWSGHVLRCDERSAESYMGEVVPRRTKRKLESRPDLVLCPAQKESNSRGPGDPVQ